MDPALAFAFNSGGGYATAGALPFGVQVDDTTPVPLPAAVWLLGTGLVGLGSSARCRRHNQVKPLGTILKPLGTIFV
jgi:hypothetical protein